MRVDRLYASNGGVTQTSFSSESKQDKADLQVKQPREISHANNISIIFNRWRQILFFGNRNLTHDVHHA